MYSYPLENFGTLEHDIKRGIARKDSSNLRFENFILSPSNYYYNEKQSFFNAHFNIFVKMCGYSLKMSVTVIHLKSHYNRFIYLGGLNGRNN